MYEDNEPSLRDMDDYEKPMPKGKVQLLTKIAVIIGGAIAVYIIIGLSLGQFT